LVEGVALALRPKRVLDVGGGQGTESLKGFETYLLDPYVTSTPCWMAGRVSWEDIKPGSFDLIVARGSLNYLSDKELARLYSALSPSRGVFLANTFATQPPLEWTARAYTRADGKQGMERFCLKGDLVHHELLMDGEPPIQHTFRYITRRHLEYFMPEVSFVFYGRNSQAIVVRRGEAK
jgi:hypothetical protein